MSSPGTVPISHSYCLLLILILLILLLLPLVLHTQDLLEDDVMILDAYTDVFVWIGKSCNSEEKKAALQTAIKYIETDTSGRSVDATTILTVRLFLTSPVTCTMYLSSLLSTGGMSVFLRS